MTLWLAFALMTAAAIFAVLWPLSRTRATRSGSDMEVYRDQLDEIERDRATGLIGEPEAEAARVEVSRRLIAASETQSAISSDPRAGLWRRRAAAVAALVVVPLVAGTIYLLHGSPQLSDPAIGGQQGDGDRSVVAMITQVEKHLETNPKDARGWEVLAPIYLRLGRFDDAVKARRHALEYGGDSAQRQSDLGEALVAAANGVVTVDAKHAFDRAVAKEPAEAKARFYLGLAAQQDGDATRAADIWQSLLKDAPGGAPWIATVQQALASVGKAPAPGPTAGDIAAASRMSEADRSGMVRGMVTGLAERLKQDGSDVEGWLRLLRAYVVLGERDKANEAASAARRALASDPEKVRQINEFAQVSGLNG